MVWALTEREKEDVKKFLRFDLERLAAAGEHGSGNFNCIANILQNFNSIFPSDKDENTKGFSNGDEDDDSFREVKMMKYLLEPCDVIKSEVSVRNFSKGMHLEMDASGRLFLATTFTTEVSIKRSYPKS